MEILRKENAADVRVCDITIYCFIRHYSARVPIEAN